MSDSQITLVIAEHDNSRLAAQTANVVNAARKLGQPVHVLVAGKDCIEAAELAARIDGVGKVLVADSDGLAHQLPEPVALAVHALAAQYSAILAPATARGRSLLPRVAALLDMAQLSDVTAIVAPNVFERPIYAGNALEVVQCDEPVRLLTVRPSAFEAAGSQADAPVEAIGVTAEWPHSSFVGAQRGAADRPELVGAKVVVSGGRAFGSAERFRALLEPLADKLGAAIGASRAAVDAGYASNDLQVGQTGQIVAPQLYIACGISGAIQHIAGMKDAKVIVAINSDPDAPIFGIADYGLVGDINTLLPELTCAL